VLRVVVETKCVIAAYFQTVKVINVLEFLTNTSYKCLDRQAY